MTFTLSRAGQLCIHSPVVARTTHARNIATILRGYAQGGSRHGTRKCYLPVHVLIPALPDSDKLLELLLDTCFRGGSVAFERDQGEREPMIEGLTEGIDLSSHSQVPKRALCEWGEARSRSHPNVVRRD